MTIHDAKYLVDYIDSGTVPEAWKFWYDGFKHRLLTLDMKPDDYEAKKLNELYRITAGGGDKQPQPFKQYKRKTSWGVR